MFCRVCGVQLTPGVNCSLSSFENYNYICRECKNKHDREYRKNITYDQKLRKKIVHTLNQHRRQGYEVLGSYENYLERYTGYCVFCGKEFDIFSSDRHDNGSLDRKNNDGVITPVNTQWLCYRCNRMKSDNSNKEYLDYIMKILPKLQSLV